MKKFAMTCLALMLTLSLVPMTALAHNTDEHADLTAQEHREALRSEAASRKEEAAKKREAATEVKRERLADVKLKVCEKRQTQVNKIMDRVVTRSTMHFERITTASERAQAFYLKQGNVLSNYDELVATAASTKTAAQTAITELEDKATFSCTSDAPKADIQDFMSHRTHKIEAMSAYRDAVKALIKGIKSVQPAEAETSEAN